MKPKYIATIVLCLLVWGAGAQQTFSSREQLNEYIFQNTDFSTVTSGYFLNFDDELKPSLMDSLFMKYNKDSTDINKLISFLQLIELTDVSHTFEADSVLSSVFSQSYINYGTNTVLFPIIIGDIDFDYLKSQKYHELNQWSGTSPFSALQNTDLKSNNIKITGVCASTIVNNDIQLYWSDETVFNNTGKIIDKVEIIIGNDTIAVPKAQALSINRYYDESTPLKDIQVKVSYTDSSSFIKFSSVDFMGGDFPQSIVYSENNEKSGGHNPFWDLMGGFGVQTSINGNVENNPDPNELDVDFNTVPNLNFSVLWGCDPIYGKTLDKPFVILGGWGPYTDRSIINNHSGWPETIEEQYYNFNQKGYIDSLVGYGYDVIVARFFPPNASILKNSDQLEKLINLVNEEKFYNNSYQENVISGYSAGSMCTRLTLERMEHKHLQDASQPHHHSKLYISFDGEHGGANVPLALQHAVEYLDSYNGGLGITDGLKVVALHYILNAPLSRELLRYFYTATGTSSNPGQGADIARTNYLNYFGWNNHAKNTLNPDYPSFTRNISISNGTSVRTNGSPLSTYYPYHKPPGEVLFKTNTNSKSFEMYMLGNPNGVVFRYEKKSWGSWHLLVDAVTSNPLILDNAAGGTTPLADPDKCDDPNIMYNVLHLMKKKTPGTPTELRKEVMYTFTPTVLAHDFRNFSPVTSPSGGLMYYDMKAEGLMYQSLNDVNNNVVSNVFGYPHLAYSNDHYTITPFDAVFAWDEENTVHLSSGNAYWENGGTQPSSNCNAEEDHKRWEEVDSPVREQMRTFLLREADTYDAFIQNRHYGWNANPSTVYKADIVSKHNIYAGDHVSQRTDFKPVELDANADIRFIACKQIVLEPGFSTDLGAAFEATIESALCNFCSYSGIPQVNHGQQNNRINQEIQQHEQTTAISEWNLEEDKVKIYPNPSESTINIALIENDATSFYYAVYDLSGKLIDSQNVQGKATRLTLERGVYFVQLKINESCITKKVVIY